MDDNSAHLLEMAKTLGELKQGQDLLIKAIMGNGQPGLQQRVEDLEAHENKITGAVAVVGTLGAGLWGFLEYLFHFSKGSK